MNVLITALRYYAKRIAGSELRIILRKLISYTYTCIPAWRRVVTFRVVQPHKKNTNVRILFYRV